MPRTRPTPLESCTPTARTVVPAAPRQGPARSNATHEARLERLRERVAQEERSVLSEEEHNQQLRLAILEARRLQNTSPMRRRLSRAAGMARKDVSTSRRLRTLWDASWIETWHL